MEIIREYVFSIITKHDEQLSLESQSKDGRLSYFCHKCIL